uniref:Uncharacterized protein n=1 Tax=Candidatus Kentrum sp. LFY TaxID=2126342 RepID=A0A450U7N1_9GAMM|nr:MAG: hypothetical protein BECKLFY1418A_GA0070994_100243 [Candidatus Kentron sp. LFY]
MTGGGSIRLFPARLHGWIEFYKVPISPYRHLAKLVLEPTKHDLASVKQNWCFVKFDLFAKLSGK